MKFDDANWPIVHIAMGETFDTEAVNEYIRRWESYLARQVRFGLIVEQRSDRTDRPGRDVTQPYMQWCKANKPRIAEYCAGMAVVLPSPKLLMMYKPLTAISTRKMYGCPGKAFADTDEALKWLKEIGLS